MMTLFFELLRVAIGTQRALSRTPFSEEWQKVIGLFSGQAMTGICAKGIHRLANNQQPEMALFSNCLAATFIIQQNNALSNTSCVQLQSYLRNKGFASCILKGQGLGQCYGEMAGLRQPGDIDVWMWPVNADGSLKSLSRWKRRKAIYAFARRFSSVGKPVYHNVAVRYRNNIPVEMHFTPSWFFSPIRNLRLQRWLDTQAPCQFRNEVELQPGQSVCVASLDFNRVFVLIHIYRHLFGDGIGIKQLLDYFFVLRSSSHYDKAATRQLLRSFGMERFARAVTWILKEQMGLEDEFLFCEPDAAEGAFLLDEVISSGGFELQGKPADRDKHTGYIGTFFKRISRNFRFVTHYTDEVLWCPLWKIWHQLWLIKFRRTKKL